MRMRNGASRAAQAICHDHVLGFPGKPTYKMEHGNAAQNAIEALERRRRFREYGLAEGRRHFGVPLYSRELGISGKLDLRIQTADDCYPVDFKYTTGRPHHQSPAPTRGYSLLVAEHFSKPVPAGFIFLIGEDVTFRFAMTVEMLSEARAALSAMQDSIEGQIFGLRCSVNANRQSDLSHSRVCRLRSSIVRCLCTPGGKRQVWSLSERCQTVRIALHKPGWCRSSHECISASFRERRRRTGITPPIRNVRAIAPRRPCPEVEWCLSS